MGEITIRMEKINLQKNVVAEDKDNVSILLICSEEISNELYQIC